MKRNFRQFCGASMLLAACSAAGKSSNTVVDAGGANSDLTGNPDPGITSREGGLGSPIDYSIWALQLPTGSGTSITIIAPQQLLDGFSNEYFYPAADGSQAFMDPATGITTPGSQHCRSEMRERSAAGPAHWPGSGSHSMTVSGKVLQVGGGANGKVTVGQLFNDSDSVPLCELEYSTSAGGFTLLYEEAKGVGTTTDLMTKVALDERYEFILALINGMLTVSINGKEVYSKEPSAAVAGKSFYFKFGNYDQTTMGGAISAVPYTIVEVFSVDVSHS